jgi:murein DD-endopeptidase MepM/ murein hydrolase activator NlpD
VKLLLALALTGCATTAPVATSSLREIAEHGCDALQWPVLAQVSSPFGVRDDHPHTGIDLPVPEGTPVVAACDGVVTYADDKVRGYGELVIVDHGAALTTMYAHNSTLLVHVGDRISRGQAIARSGQTGNARGPHVHFELRLHDRAIDPMPHLVRYAEGPLAASRL